jgi:nucleolar protein 56
MYTKDALSLGFPFKLLIGTNMTSFLLYESASGYGLFEVTKLDEIGQGTDALQQTLSDITRFGKAVKLTAFKPFTSAADALEQINAVSESQVRCMHHIIEKNLC